MTVEHTCAACPSASVSGPWCVAHIPEQRKRRFIYAIAVLPPPVMPRPSRSDYRVPRAAVLAEALQERTP